MRHPGAKRLALSLLALCLFAVACSTSTDAPGPSRTSTEDRAASLERAASVVRLARGLASPDVVATSVLGERGGFARAAGAGFASLGARGDRTAREIVAATAPVAANDAWSVSAAGSEVEGIRLTPVGAAAVDGVLHEGVVAYPGVYPEVDLVYAATPNQAEALYVLAGAGAPTTFSWRLELGAALASARLDGAGNVDIVDRAGASRLRIQRPAVFDAKGVRRAATMELDGGRLTLRFDPTGLAYPILVDPLVDAATWSVVRPTGQGQRTDLLAAFDSDRQKVVLFGGWERAQATFTQTWEWSQASGFELKATSGPPVNVTYSMAYDRARRVTVLVSNTLVGAALDVWEWSGAAWARRTPGPGPTAGGHLVYFRDKLRLLSYVTTTDQYGNSTTTLQMWLYDGQWTRETAGDGARVGIAVASDPSRDRLVLLSINRYWTGSSTDNPVVEWNGTTWTEVTVPQGTPVVGGRYIAGLAYKGGGETLLFGGRSVSCGWSDCGYGIYGDVLEWGGTQWDQRPTTTAPSPRYGHAMVWDDVQQRTLVFGGNQSNYASQGDQDGLAKFTGEVWQYTPAGAWTRLKKSGAPAPREKFSVAYSSVTHETLLLGGDVGSDEFWAWNGARWDERDAYAPSRRQRYAMAYDERRHALVMLNGDFASTTGGDPMTGGVGRVDTLTYNEDISSWQVHRAVATDPPPSTLASAAWDSTRELVVLFGGFGGASSADVQDKTWTWNGAGWTPKTPPASPSARFGAAMVHDRARNVTVLFGGAGAWGQNCGYYGCTWTQPEQLKEDTWEWNGTTWLQRAPANRPSARYGHSLVWNSVRQRVQLLGGSSGANELWEWNGSDWTRLSTNLPANIVAATYDTQRKLIVAVPGVSGPGEGQVYEIRTRGTACTAGTECESGSCVDGVCCEASSCPGACQACNVPGNEGVCAVPVGLPSPSGCSSPSVCGATGQCGKADGQTCSSATECSSRNCVDGVCCNNACVGGCNRCDLPGDRLGKCSVVAAGTLGSNPSCGDYVCNGTGEACPTSCTSGQACVPGGSCIGNACVRTKEPGAACSANIECRLGFCVEGVCCDSACSGTNECRSCTAAGKGIGPDGVCGDRRDGTKCAGPDVTCSGTQGTGPLCQAGVCRQGATRDCAPFGCTATGCAVSCTGASGGAGPSCAPGSSCVQTDTGAFVCTGDKTPGLACTNHAECTTGHCANGVCCTTTCSGDCQACTKALKANGTPDGECGVARAGVSCDTDAPAACSNGNITGRLCNANGACVDGATASCTPYGCSTSGRGCATACSAAGGTNVSACRPGFTCDTATGACLGSRPAGALCAANGECGSNTCVGGVCCSSACDGPCERCDLDGVCKPFARGAAPRSEACGTYTCNGTSGACSTQCSAAGDCVTGIPCNTGECRGSLANGAACTIGAACASGVCADGVCCNRACGGCEACSALAKDHGVDGVCEYVAAGLPHGDACADSAGAAACGTDGTCDGKGGCRKYPLGTPCGALGRCKSAYVLEGGDVCNGLGACVSGSGQTTFCLPYLCREVEDGSAPGNRLGLCRIKCSTHEDCGLGTFCESGTCRGNLEVGVACEYDFQCKAGNCADGVCCNSPCGGQCESCNVAGSVGQCKPVPKGGNPSAGKTACRGAGTTCAGTCDGVSTSCVYASGQECGTSCDKGQFVESTCDNGACQAKAPRTCAPYACSLASSRCRVECETEADCAAGNQCVAKQCQPKPSGSCVGPQLLKTQDGREIQCIAYKCQGDRCKESCASVEDCQDGFACDSSGRCILETAALLGAGGGGGSSAEKGGCGCKVAGEPRPSGQSAALAALVVAAFFGRRREGRARRGQKANETRSSGDA